MYLILYYEHDQFTQNTVVLHFGIEKNSITIDILGCYCWVSRVRIKIL